MRISRRGQGAPVLFVHPALLNGSYWDEVTARAPEGYASWVVDLPDHVEDEPGHDLAATEAALIETVLRFDEPVVLAGASLGAYLAARVARAHPARVGRLALHAGLASLPPAMVDAYADLAASAEEGSVQTPALALQLVEGAGGSRLPAAWRARLVSELSSWPPDRVVRSLRRVAEIGEAPLVRRSKIPTTVQHARDDSSVPIALARELSQMHDGSVLDELEDGGHLLALTEPDHVAAAVYG